MKIITKNIDYAIRALCYIAKHEEGVVSVSELAKCLKVPGPFLRKILQMLSKKGILKSYKGKSGGFVLTRNTESISLARLIEIFQGPLQAFDHTFKKRICPEAKRCPLKKSLDAIEEYLKAELDSITVASLLKKGGWKYGKKKNYKNR